MPYKNRKMKIPRELDRRVRVTEEMSENMLTMYRDGASLHAIAREFGVDRKTVKRYVVPGYIEEMSAIRKARKPWLVYYDKDRWRELMKGHRHYKRELEKTGKLLPPEQTA